jgi:hypothetical protein
MRQDEIMRKFRHPGWGDDLSRSFWRLWTMPNACRLAKTYPFDRFQPDGSDAAEVAATQRRR